MKITHFTASETGGAGIATMRIHKALLALGHESAIRFLETKSEKRTRFQKAAALVRPVLDRAFLEIVAPRRTSFFSAAWVPNAALRKTSDADVIHLHWTDNGFLDVAALRGVRRPIVWTLHDMWPFTGGCFYDGGCGRWASGCGRCPILPSSKDGDLSAKVFRRKEKAWSGVDLTVVAPSRWMAEQARRSPLFERRRIEVISNCLDPSVFKPVDKAMARGVLNLPGDAPLILFGAVHPRAEARKGYHHLVASMQYLEGLHTGPRKPEFVVFGEGMRERREKDGWVWHSLGRLSDEFSLALAYSAADVFVAPSEQESFGMVAMESMACGTPAVAFRVGGMLDQIVHKENGYLAEPFDARQLAEGIAWVLSSDLEALGRKARAGVLENFVSEVVGPQYARLYAEVAGRN